MVAWRTTGDGYRRNASFGVVVVVGGGGCWQAFQLSFWTDTKERVIRAKTIQSQRLISVWIWNSSNTGLCGVGKCRHTLYFLFPPTSSLLQLWSENHYIDLIFFFFQQRQENGLPSELSERFNPTLILQAERNLSFKSQGNTDKERNRYDSDAWVLARLLQLCPTHCGSTDHSLPGSSVHGILQARILEWVAMPSSGVSSQSRNWTCVSHVSCIGRQVLNH